MPNIRIDLDTSVLNGQTVTFKSPANCSDITGLTIYYPEGDITTSKEFQFADAHGIDVGSGTINLFAANVLVKVVLDVDQGKAYVQNADTNKYLEDRFELLTPITSTTDITAGSAATDGRPYHVID